MSHVTETRIMRVFSGADSEAAHFTGKRLDQTDCFSFDALN